jgi:uncharacterized protein with von Willebrand factor type A (vWA) domain
MSPYEITMPGGSVEHWNEVPGRLAETRPPTEPPEKYWSYSPRSAWIREVMTIGCTPRLIDGLDKAMRALTR